MSAASRSRIADQAPNGVVARAGRWRQASIALAVGVLVLLGWRQQLNFGITIGYVAALAVLPVWAPALRRYGGYPMFFFLGAASLIAGFILSNSSSSNHQIDQSKLIINATLLVGLLLTAGVVLWARQLMPDWLVCAAYGLGMFLGVPKGGDVLINPWKFGYSLPVIVLVLSVAALMITRFRMRRPWVELLALAVLAAYSGLNDSRSLFAMLALVAVLVMWQMLPAGKNLRRAIYGTVLTAVAVIIITYEVGSALLVDGYLGAAAQQRSIAQINTSGNLIIGGRPEIAATVALMKSQPWGFGLGVVPSLADIAVAKTGMAAVHYEPNNGYVERYMFGSQFELHSVVGDLWVHFGLLGLLLAVAALSLTLRWCLIAVATRRGSAIVLFLAVITVWNLFFSPLYSSVTIMGLALGMIAIRGKRRDVHKKPAAANPF